MPEPIPTRLRVTYHPAPPGFKMHNLLWTPTYPMRNGRFRPPHPCAANPEPTTFGAPAPTEDPLGRFRGRGYYASCFPEGDGICFHPLAGEKTDAETMRDIAECFGFEVRHA